MNGKKAKAIRRAARQISEETNTPEQFGVIERTRKDGTKSNQRIAMPHTPTSNTRLIKRRLRETHQ